MFISDVRRTFNRYTRYSCSWETRVVAPHEFPSSFLSFPVCGDGNVNVFDTKLVFRENKTFPTWTARTVFFFIFVSTVSRRYCRTRILTRSIVRSSETFSQNPLPAVNFSRVFRLYNVLIFRHGPSTVVRTRAVRRLYRARRVKTRFRPAGTRRRLRHVIGQGDPQDPTDSVRVFERQVVFENRAVANTDVRCEDDRFSIVSRPNKTAETIR